MFSSNRAFLKCGLWIRRLGENLERCLRSESGATTTEYALILALVVIVLISSLTALGDALKDKLQTIISQIEGAS